MREKSVAEILAGQGTVNTETAAYHQMVFDGEVLHRPVREALISGDFAHVPLINGATANEGNLFYGDGATKDDYIGAVSEFSRQNHKDAAWTEAVYALSEYDAPRDAARAILGDAEFSCPALQISNWASIWTPVYSYEFSDPQSLADSGHFADIYYLFAFKDEASFGIHGERASQALASSMQAYWANFAKWANPNGPTLPYWPRYSLAAPMIQSLSTAAIAHQGMTAGGEFIDRHSCEYWGAF